MIVEPTLLDHPKFLKLARRLGEGRALIVLIRLWGHCQAECRREFWPGADAEYVEAVGRWDGEAGVAFEALRATGFVVQEEGGVRIHDWDSMNASMLTRWDNGKQNARKRASVKHPPHRNTVPGPPDQPPNGCSVNRMHHRNTVPGLLRGDEMRGEDTPLPPEGGEGGDQPASEAGSDSQPDSGGAPTAALGTAGDVARQIERVWAVWPKKIQTLHAMVAIGDAIRRDGFERVLAGTQAICEADGKRGVSPPGRYLPMPTAFFAESRYLDDPAQYAPREGAAGGVAGVPLGIRVRELANQLDGHHGNPFRQQPDPTLSRDWWRLHRELQALRIQLLDAEAEPLSVRIDQGRHLLDIHVGNPDNALGSLKAKEEAEPEFRALRRKVKGLRGQMRTNGEEKGEA